MIPDPSEDLKYSVRFSDVGYSVRVLEPNKTFQSGSITVINIMLSNGVAPLANQSERSQ